MISPRHIAVMWSPRKINITSYIYSNRVLKNRPQNHFSTKVQQMFHRDWNSFIHSATYPGQGHPGSEAYPGSSGCKMVIHP